MQTRRGYCSRRILSAFRRDGVDTLAGTDYESAVFDFQGAFLQKVLVGAEDGPAFAITLDISDIHGAGYAYGVESFEFEILLPGGAVSGHGSANEIDVDVAG